MLLEIGGFGWWRGCLAAVFLAVSARHAGAQVGPGADSPWARAVDDYLTGDQASAIAALQHLSPEEVATQSRAALYAWMDRALLGGHGVDARDKWRRAIRRVQGAALLPLEILSSLSTQRVRPPPIMNAYEAAAIEAWQFLGEAPQSDPQRAANVETRIRQRQFRAWWQIAHLQFLMNVGRHAEFRKRAEQVILPGDDPTLRGEFFLLRGMTDETDARVPPPEGSPNLAWVPDGRQRTLMLGFDTAAGWYRRVLDVVPGHIEARLHLGRTLLDLKRLDDAIGALRPLLANPCGTTECALASLFTGEAHEMREALDEAARAYALASSRFEVRQPALVALMQLSARGSDAANDTGLIGQFENATPLARRAGPDAWSVYLSGRRQHIDAVLGPLREAMSP